MANVKPVERGEIGNAEEGEGRAEGLAAVAAKPCCPHQKEKEGLTPSFSFCMEPMANVKPVGRGGIGNAEEGEGRAEGLAAVAAKENINFHQNHIRLA